MVKVRKEIIIIGVLLLLVIVMIGVSYAAFRFMGEGTKLNTITTGSITMEYTESSNTISLTGALPTTDETGKKRLNPGEYFDFTVSSEIVGDVNINYEISAKEVGEGTIEGKYIKLYLTKIREDGTEEELITPEVYNEEPSSNDYTGRPNGEMSLYTSSMNSSESNKYRLRMYVDESYNPQDDGGGLTFSVQINVYGKDGDRPLTGAEMLIKKANPEDLDYNSATDEEKKEMWTFSHPETEQTEALTDYRYIGADPNNYVEFNDELWRIIGVFTVDDGTGKMEQRLKIIRNESIGKYEWDNKDETTGAEDEWGKNDWTDARLNYLLNPGHENESAGGSLYWNSDSGFCYAGYKNATVPCDFIETGLKEKAKSMIGDTVWYLGGASEYEDSSNGLARHFYSYERGVTVYEGRDTSWIGKVGLMYPSDYGYATSGNSITDRDTCLNNELYNWDWDCSLNTWIFNSSYTPASNLWTITPSSYGNEVFILGSGGFIASDVTAVNRYYGIRPVVFLKSNIKISSGDGSSSNPYVLQS